MSDIFAEKEEKKISLFPEEEPKIPDPITTTPSPFAEAWESGKPAVPEGLKRTPIQEFTEGLYDPATALFQSLAALENPTDEINRINASQYIASRMGIDPKIAYTNLEELSEYWLGKVTPPQVFTQSVKDAWENGMRNYEIGKLAAKLSTKGGTDPEIMQQIAELESAMVPWNDNNTPLPFIKNAILTAAESAPLMAQSMLKGGGIAAGIAGVGAIGIGLATGGVTLPITLGIMSTVFSAGNAVDLADVMRGLQYYDLIKKNVPHEVAAPISNVSGILQGAIEFMGERFLGLIPGMPGLGTIVANKILTTGIVTTIGVRIAANIAAGALGEGIEEVLQEFTSIASEQLARELSQQKGIETDIKPFTVQELADRTAQAAKGGFSGGLVFGVMGIPFGIYGDVKQFNTIKEKATSTPDKRTFINAAKDMVPKDSHVNEAAWQEYLGKVWDKQHPKAEPITAAVTQAEKGKAVAQGKLEPIKPEYRTPEQTLHTEYITQRKTKEGTSALLKAGDPTTGERYGYITYETTRDGIYIDQVVNEVTQDIRRDMILDLAAKHPGMEIEWNPVEVEEVEFKEAMVADNPRGPEYGLQYFAAEEAAPREALTRSIFTQRMAEIFNLSAKEAEQFGIFADILARNEGIATNEWLAKYFAPEVGQVTVETEEQLAKGKGVAGTAFKMGATTVSPMAVDLEQFKGQIRAVFTALERADFHQGVHEFFHAVERLALSKEQTKNFETALGKLRENWTVDDIEKLANYFEDYLGTGQAPTPELQTVFRQIAQLLHQLISYLRERVERGEAEVRLSPEFQTAYDALFTKPETAFAQTEQIELATPEIIDVADGVQDDIMAPELTPEEPPVTITTFDWSTIPVVEAPIADITLSKEVPNFKEETTEKGLIEPLEGTVYERLGTAPIVLWERLDGKLEVITGRHRLDLAQRTGENTIPAQIVREADGFTAAQAMTFDAESNIRDGQGSIKDYGQYFRFTKITEEDAHSRGLLARDKGRKGFAIGKYATDGLYTLYRNEKITDTKAAAIASTAPNDEQLQDVGITQAKELSADELINYLNILKTKTPTGETTQFDLFGKDESFMIEAAAMAREAVKKIGELRTEYNALRGALRLSVGERKKIVQKYGFETGDVMAVQDRANQLEIEIEEWTEWTTDPAKHAELRERMGKGMLFHPDKGIPIEPDTLSKEVLSKMNQTLKATGYDVHGATDVLKLLKEGHVVINGILRQSDWVAAYEKAIGSVGARKQRLAAKAKERAQYTNIYWERIRELGKTTNLKEAGYVYPDGSLLDLSGKREGWTPGTRVLDHTEVGGKRGMQEFMALGNIRMDYNAGIFDIAKMPTSDQYAVIERIARRKNGEIIIDLAEGLGEYDTNKQRYQSPERTFAREYSEGTSPVRILNDIKRFYSGQEPLKMLFHPDVLVTGGEPLIQQKTPEGERIREAISNIEKRLSRLEAGDFTGELILGRTDQPGLIARIKLLLENLRKVTDKGAKFEYPTRAHDWSYIHRSTRPEEAGKWRVTEWNDQYGPMGHHLAWGKPGEGLVSPGKKSTTNIDDLISLVYQESMAGYKITETRGTPYYLLHPDIVSSWILENVPETEERSILFHYEERWQRELIYGTPIGRGIWNQYVEEAKAYDSPEAFRAAMVEQYGQLHEGDIAGAQETEFYKQTWEEAHQEPEEEAEPSIAIESPELKDEAKYDYSDKMDAAKDIGDSGLAKKMESGEITEEELNKLSEAGEEESISVEEQAAVTEDEVAGELKKLTPEERLIISLGDRLEAAITEAETEDVAGREERRKAIENKIKNLYTQFREALLNNLEAAENILTEMIWEKAIIMGEEMIGERAEDRISESYEKAVALGRELQKAIDKRKAKEVAEKVKIKHAESRAKIYAKKRQQFEDYKKKLREKKAERRAIKKYREAQMKLINDIMRPPGKSISYKGYAEAIREIQRGLDPKRRQKRTIYSREQSRVFFAKNPEAAALVPQEKLEKIYSVRLTEMTLAQLEDIDDMIKNLRKLGRLKRHLELLQELRLRVENRGECANAVLRGKEPQKPVGGIKPTRRYLRLLLPTLKPGRIALLLDGVFEGGNAGPFTRWLQDEPNAAWQEMQKTIHKRMDPIFAKMEELKLTLDPIDVKRITKGFTWIGETMDIEGFHYTNGKKPTINDVLFWSIGMQNEKTKAALLHGNNLPADVILKGITMLTPEQKALADAIAADFEINFVRLRDAFIAIFNIDLPGEDHYVPHRRLEISYQTRDEEIAADLTARAGVRKQFIARHPTYERIDMKDEHQKPIRTDLVGLWIDGVKVQEGFIHQDQLIKRLHSIMESDEVRHAVQQKYGPALNKWISQYINDLAQADAYQAMSGPEKFSRMVRSNAAVSWLAFNLLPNLKQLTGVFNYLADTGPFHLASAAAQFAAGKGKSIIKGKFLNNTLIDFVDSKTELLRNRQISQEFEELKKMNYNLWARFVKKIGTLGMKSLENIDKVTVYIGWKAVYDKVMSETGGIEAEAIQAADKATVRTQPSHRVQDMAEIYRGGEILKWFTMFTSELSVTWNRLAFDVPMAIKRKEFLHALGDIVSFSIIGLGIAIASGALQGDDEEKKKKIITGLFSQYIEAIPFFGNDLFNVISGKQFQSGGVKLFPAYDYLTKIPKQLAAGDYDKAIKNLIDGASMAVGLPVSGPRKVMRMIESKELRDLLGWPKE